MLRLLKPATAILTLAALGLLAASCGSSGPQVRVVNTLSNDGNPYIPLDIYVNLSKINSTSLGFGGVYPNQQPSGPAGYAGVPSGSDAIAVFDSGDPTTDATILGENSSGAGTAINETFSNGSQYTVVLAGSVDDTVNPPTVLSFTDDNTLPPTGFVEFRIIDASVFLSEQYQQGLDIYFEQGAIGGTPQISGLTYKSIGPGYVQVAFTSGDPEITVYVTPHGEQTQQLITYSTAQLNEQINTLVIYDEPNNSGYSRSLLAFTDLN
jgi:hypothetical protein